MAGPKIVFLDTKCAVGNSECVVGIYLMCGSVFRKSLKLLPSDVIFKAEVHQIRFRLGSAPDPTWGGYGAPPDS